MSSVSGSRHNTGFSWKLDVCCRAALTIPENEVGSVRETPPEEEKTVNNRLCEGGGIKRATMSVGH